MCLVPSSPAVENIILRDVGVVFGSNTSSPNQVNGGKKNSKSEDPFGIYDMLSNKKDNVTSESRPSLSHPPGFTPEGVVHHEMLGTVNGDADNNGGKDNPVPVKEMHSDSVGSKTVHNGGSMLGVMEDFIRIGQAMGYAMEGSVNDLATII
nr:RNA-directed DNA polymerase, eukaryota [Tanacetum cinerariifolium]